VVAPVAVNVIAFPLQIEVSEETVITGDALTVTETFFATLQPFFVPVTVYVIFADGFAVTTADVVLFSAVEGAHEYVAAPPALNVAEPPLHIVVLFVRVNTGNAVTVNAIVLAALHPLVVPVTV
jgi:hypothetical protein